MADKGFIKAMLQGVPDARTRTSLEKTFTYTESNFRFGEPEHQTRTENAQLYWMASTTASDTSEFSIVHGLVETPRYAIPVLELGKVGSRAGGLVVSRAADGKRLYLKADVGSTNAPVMLLVE